MTAKKKKSTESRHGKRRAGKTATSISLSEDLLRKAQEEAAADGRSLSNWIEQRLREALSKAGKLGPFILD